MESYRDWVGGDLDTVDTQMMPPGTYFFSSQRTEDTTERSFLKVSLLELFKTVARASTRRYQLIDFGEPRLQQIMLVWDFPQWLMDWINEEW